MLFEEVVFAKARFIKPDIPFVFEHAPTNSAPLLRKAFTYTPGRKAELRVCALGYGEFYLNGKLVTEDKLIAPVSDYTKTLWVTSYDVTALLVPGENFFAAVLGNGFYNESLKTAWNFNEAVWRDIPKLIAEITADSEPILFTDAGWKCKTESAIVYNQLRSGEHYDARLHIPGWNAPDFDDSTWEEAIPDDTPPAGTLRLCTCQPIRECAVYPALTMKKTGEGRYLFDIGQNISGYVRLTAHEPAGTELVIRYSEEIEGDELKVEHLGARCYPESEFMTDHFISDGKEWTWSPRFTYHGFQYIEISGFTKEPALESVQGVFVHQDVAVKKEFHSEDERLNRLFHAMQMATLSNLFYMPTDCPTREKLGWCNDAQSSCDQMLTNFDTARFFRKWLQDIFDAMREDGALPGIIPTAGWGFHWGNGPVSDGILFEIPYQLFRHTGDDSALKEAMPYFKRYLDYLETRRDEDGLIRFGLNDWAAPDSDIEHRTPDYFVNAVLRIKFLRIAALAEERFGGSEGYAARAEQAVAEFRRTFFDENGICSENTMTAAAMVLYHDLYIDLNTTKAQLMERIEASSYRHHCGMVGMPCLFPALEKCGLHDVVMRILLSEGEPSYMNWLNKGATTLWEMWHCGDSHNHHMYSSGVNAALYGRG